MAGKMVLITLIFLVMGNKSNAQVHPDLKAYQWKNRLIVINGVSDVHKQIEVFDQPSLADRNMKILILQKDQVVTNDKDTLRIDPNAIREHLNIPQNDYAVLLIGKDGGIKMRKNEFVNPNIIYALIDQMPMRQSEMKSKH